MWWPISSAKDSLSQIPSHQRIVTRLPNHMCAISCAMTWARNRRIPSVVRERNTNSSSVKVTSPGFSIAPALNSGQKTWS